MEIRYHNQFNRDLRRLRNPSLAAQIEQIIEELKAASTIRDVHGVSRMTNSGEHYRIRIREYRLGITMDGETAVLRRFLPRGVNGGGMLGHWGGVKLYHLVCSCPPKKSELSGQHKYQHQLLREMPCLRVGQRGQAGRS